MIFSPHLDLVWEFSTSHASSPRGYLDVFGVRHIVPWLSTHMATPAPWEDPGPGVPSIAQLLDGCRPAPKKLVGIILPKNSMKIAWKRTQNRSPETRFV